MNPADKNVTAMLRENEVVMLVLGIGVLFLFIMNMDFIRKIRFWKILFYSYSVLICGWLFTVLEEFILTNFLNFLEHISYLLSAMLIFIWAWKSTGSKSKEDSL
ncbi:MAG TPA: hypothetical protein VHI78_05820 [Bacteroidales bacterium]|jgi:hypothetical protein|nr:hypothetical protein [Bacteroidales bacterium]